MQHKEQVRNSDMDEFEKRRLNKSFVLLVVGIAPVKMKVMLIPRKWNFTTLTIFNFNLKKIKKMKTFNDSFLE